VKFAHADGSDFAPILSKSERRLPRIHDRDVRIDFMTLSWIVRANGEQSPTIPVSKSR
jgi:hypothetical protein